MGSASSDVVRGQDTSRDVEFTSGITAVGKPMQTQQFSELAVPNNRSTGAAAPTSNRL